MSATPADAKRLTIAAVGASAMFAAVGELHDRELPRMRIAIGAVVVGAALAMGAEWFPGVVAPFAALILVGALVTTAPPVVRRIGDAVNAGGPAPPVSGFSPGAGVGGGTNPGQTAGGGGGGSSW